MFHVNVCTNMSAVCFPKLQPSILMVSRLVLCAKVPRPQTCPFLSQLNAIFPCLSCRLDHLQLFASPLCHRCQDCDSAQGAEGETAQVLLQTHHHQLVQSCCSRHQDHGHARSASPT